ncbi:hypothetical protein FB459_2189 [Yimella lutea]|uniref:Uncharacterized protein n=1 Tax=Yimella lutea TaxID=587872 RepID=A0A542EH78_9MICO|nr:hypothetical protein [Yimella lutea]TQJ14690.1 hypothetical protein FB459_2189 [Yimella lutea]
MTSSESNNGSGTQTPSANGTTKAVPTLEPGQTGPATAELGSLNTMMHNISGYDGDPAEVAKPACTRLFGPDAAIGPVVGTAVVLANAGRGILSKPPTEVPGQSDLQRWSLSCLWVDSSTPDAGVSIRLENNKLTPGQVAEDVDTKATEGWGVVCLVAPTQWSEKQPQGNLFYDADKNAKWPDAWAGQKDQNGVTVGCRANHRSSAQYGNSSKTRGQAIDARATKLRDIGLANLAK